MLNEYLRLLLRSCPINTFIMKEWDLYKCFCAVNTILFKQKLLQLVQWNKKITLKEKGYNGFPQISIFFNFSWINHRPLFIMDGCNKSFGINRVSSAYGSLKVLPWNNDIIKEKMDVWKWCRDVTDFFQYMRTRSQSSMSSIYNISLLEFLFCKNTVSLKEWVAAITLLS